MARACASLILVLMLLLGGTVHASVMHDHGHTHGAEGSSIWTSLHSALRHEDKKMLFAIAGEYALALLFVLFVSAAASRSRISATFTASIRDPHARDALRRGIFRYRVFV